MQKILRRWAWPLWLWLTLSLGLWLVSPVKSDRDVVVFARFYVACLVYALPLWVMCACAHGQRLGALSLLQNGIAVTGCVAFFYLLACRLPPVLAARLPGVFLLWCLLASYLWLLHSAGRLLCAWNVRRAPVWFGMSMLVAFTDVVWGEPLLARFPEARGAIWIMLGYGNPWFVAAACFPGYDVVRDTSLYTMTTLSHHGPWRYPDPRYAALAYVALGLLLSAAASWSNKITSQARVAQGKNKIHQPA